MPDLSPHTGSSDDIVRELGNICQQRFSTPEHAQYYEFFGFFSHGSLLGEHAELVGTTAIDAPRIRARQLVENLELDFARTLEEPLVVSQYVNEASTFPFVVAIFCSLEGEEVSIWTLIQDDRDDLALSRLYDLEAKIIQNYQKPLDLFVFSLDRGSVKDIIPKGFKITYQRGSF